MEWYWWVLICWLIVGIGFLVYLWREDGPYNFWGSIVIIFLAVPTLIFGGIGEIVRRCRE